MKNHFIIPYPGNKRKEVEMIHESLNLDGIETIIEPFCGSSAMSFYLSQLYPKRFKYILNDGNTNLINLYYVLKDEEKYIQLIDDVETIYNDVYNNDLSQLEQKEIYKSHIPIKDLAHYVFFHKYYNIRPYYYTIGKSPIFNRKLFVNTPIIKFIREENIELHCKDGIEIFKQYENDKSSLIFLDPPYLTRDNKFYERAEDMKFNCLDIYEYLIQKKIQDCNAVIYIVVNNCEEIINHFEKYIIHKYPKKYHYRHGKNKDTEHLIISNKLIV